MTSSQLTGKWGKTCLHATTCSGKVLEAVNTKLREFLDEHVRVYHSNHVLFPWRELHWEANDKELRLIQGPLNTPHVLREHTAWLCFCTGVQLCVEQMAKTWLLCAPSSSIEAVSWVHPWCPPPQIHEGVDLQHVSEQCTIIVSDTKHKWLGMQEESRAAWWGDFLPIGVPAVARVWAGKSHLPETMLLISLFVPTAVTLYDFFKKKKKKVFYCFIQRMSRPHSCTDEHSARHEI